MVGSGRARQASDELLVAVIPRKRDLHILESEGWYRVPIDTAPRRWPPRYIAFYEGVALSKPGHVARYAEVEHIDVVGREELFPDEAPGTRAGRRYYRVRVKELLERSEPIALRRPRPVVFISTTFAKFETATTINDLWDDSPLEDQMWKALSAAHLPAERQWPVPEKNPRYFVDFAVFCREGKVALETDGHKWHSNPERAAVDNIRQNELGIRGWKLLRFSSDQITNGLRESMKNVVRMVQSLGGAVDPDAWAPSNYVRDAGSFAHQLAFRETKSEYDSDDDW